LELSFLLPHGRNRATITQWKNKLDIMPNHKIQQKIADYFNVSLDFLCGREETKKGPAEAEPKEPPDEDDIRYALSGKIKDLTDEKFDEIMNYIKFVEQKTTLRNKEVFDRFIYAYRFQVATGLRPGELMGLMHNDIQGNTLTVRRSINVYNETTRGKNINAKRQFVLTPIAMEALDAQKTLDNESNYVFGEMCLSTYEKRWGKYCEHNRIPHTTLYELRHTFVSVGKDLRNKLKSVIGHYEDMDTFGTYGHEVQGEMESVADELQELFKRILDKETAKLEAEEKEKRKSVLINVLIDKNKTARS